MYGLSVGAVFRNEVRGMKEWLDHYLLHGVEHFYMIDDDSDDGSVAVLGPYQERGLITLYQPHCDRYLGRQRNMYTTYLLPHLTRGETDWLLMVDLDEYLWSPLDRNLYKILHTLCQHQLQIQVGVTLFGSNGHLLQPPSLVAGFTRRSRKQPTDNCCKYLVHHHPDHPFSSLNIHHATFKNPEDEKPTTFMLLGPEYFRIHHYSCQSRTFWQTVKMTRGDGDHYRHRTLQDFEDLDLNEVEDTGLLDQNLMVEE